jgi:hypothetical protein
MGSDMYMGFCSFINIPTSLILVLVQFAPQISTIWMLRKEIDVLSLSIWTLAIQMIAFFLLGISWIFRLGKPGTGYNTVQPVNGPFSWYFLVGWPYLNNILYGVGQAILFALCIYFKYRRGTGITAASSTTANSQESVNDQTPLLREL